MLAASILYSAVGVTFAYTGSTAEVHNYVRTGDIDIALKQYDKEGNPFSDERIWTPGDCIENQVFVENQAKSCWIRLQIKNDKEIDIRGISDQWVYREPYWYYLSLIHI